ncbi:endochitinase-like [Toxorhynchites rutilus septentrionalis]|uniref:endochitinase-like n=1 Tax=Toxorhynchites rutilus septentrionalis TaxID=329112 RepID=UPI00247AA8C1|nr:endochitinase-like [Toxorhynchites rutilus septentrionalis]
MATTVIQLLFAAVALSLVAGLTVNSPKGRRFICHYTTWSRTRQEDGAYTIEDIPGDMCSHVVYNFVAVDEKTFELTALQPEYDIEENALHRFTALKDKYPHLKTIAAVGGWAHGGERFSKMVEFREQRMRFVASAVKFLHKYKFDGLEVVWLYPGNFDRGGSINDKDNFYYLIRELSKAFKEENWGWEVSVQVPADKQRIESGYQMDALCEAADFINVIGYDLRGWWNNFADVHSPMMDRPHDEGSFIGLNVNNGVGQWLIEGCPASKMILGVPLFGRTYLLSSPEENGVGAPTIGAGAAGEYTNEPGYLGYCEICQVLPNMTIRYDEIGQCPFAYNTDEWIGYEDERSIRAKIDWAIKNRLAGIYAFSLDLDDYRGHCGESYPLTKVLHKYYEETKNETLVTWP